jgi:Phytanoyl-CoA dioxygenase (PhyH)
MALLDDGFIVLRGLLDADDVAHVRDGLERLPRDPSCERPENTLVPLRWDMPLVGRVLEQRAGRIAEAIGARDLRWISGYVSIKDPHSGPLDWHQDWWCWDHPVSHRPEAPQVAVLAYLTATSARNAALRVRPGSHRGAPGAPVTLALQAGDAAVIDYRLVHGTHANATASRRDCLILNFAPAWSGLPEDIRGHLIQHPALPGESERPATPWAEALLPRYDGPRRDLPLNRTPPTRYEPRVAQVGR